MTKRVTCADKIRGLTTLTSCYWWVWSWGWGCPEDRSSPRSWSGTGTGWWPHCPAGTSSPGPETHCPSAPALQRSWGHVWSCRLYLGGKKDYCQSFWLPPVQPQWQKKINMTLALSSWNEKCFWYWESMSVRDKHSKITISLHLFCTPPSWRDVQWFYKLSHSIKWHRGHVILILCNIKY